MNAMVAELCETLRGHSSDVNSVIFVGDLLCSVSSDKTVRLWKLEHGTWTEAERSPLLKHSYSVYSCSVSPFGSILVTGSLDGRAILWDSNAGAPLHVFQHKSGSGIRAVCFSPNPDTLLLATSGDDDCICLWDCSNLKSASSHMQQKPISTLSGHEASVVALAFTPDGNFLLSGSTEGDLMVWDAAYGHGVHLFQASACHDLGVTSCDTTSIGGSGQPLEAGAISCTVATAGNDNLVRLWKFAAHVGHAKVALTVRDTLAGHASAVLCCRFTHSGRLLASSSSDKTVRIWSALKGVCLHTITDGHDRHVGSVAFSADDTRLATCSGDRSVRVWRVKLETELGVSDDPIGVRPAVPAAAPESAANLPLSGPTPDEFLCPITREKMRDPVIAADGYTYERSAIESWINSGNRRSPMSNCELANLTLLPNRSLKTLIWRQN